MGRPSASQPRMTAARRRTRTGIPLAVIIAVLTAIFATRHQRAPVPSPPAAGFPTAAPARPMPDRSSDATTGAPNAGVAPDRRARTRTAPVGFTSRQRLVEHFEKHGAEFPGLSIEAYLAAAQTLRDAPVGGSVLEVRRRDGVVSRFDRATGGFLAFNRDGTIRTFFRPNDGEAYFRRQASRTPGGGP